MPIRYFFKQLLLPPGVFLLLIAAGWLLRKRYPKSAALSFWGGLLGLWVMAMPLTTEWAGKWLESEPALPLASGSQLAAQAQAIVVLGGGRQRHDPAWGGDQSSLWAQERVRYAARLARASDLPILTTGGLHFGEPPAEASMMADSLARDFDIEVRWRESLSRTTWENARLSAPLLRSAGVKSIVLVSTAAHLPRARWCFEQQGFEVIAAPVGFLGVANDRPAGGWLPEAQALWHNSFLLNEALGRLLYPLLY